MYEDGSTSWSEVLTLAVFFYFFCLYPFYQVQLSVPLCHYAIHIFVFMVTLYLYIFALFNKLYVYCKCIDLLVSSFIAVVSFIAMFI